MGVKACLAILDKLLSGSSLEAEELVIRQFCSTIVLIMTSDKASLLVTCLLS